MFTIILLGEQQTAALELLVVPQVVDHLGFALDADQEVGDALRALHGLAFDLAVLDLLKTGLGYDQIISVEQIIAIDKGSPAELYFLKIAT